MFGYCLAVITTCVAPGVCMSIYLRRHFLSRSVVLLLIVAIIKFTTASKARRAIEDINETFV